MHCIETQRLLLTAAGAEVLTALEEKLAACGFQNIRLHCSLRNAEGLRFWVHNGVSQILEVSCDGNLFAENFGSVELAKRMPRAMQRENGSGAIHAPHITLYYF